MQGPDNIWSSQVIESVCQLLIKQSREVPERSVKALVFSSIGYALAAMAQEDPHAAQVFLNCLIPNFVVRPKNWTVRQVH
jgi:hypothetical protein